MIKKILLCISISLISATTYADDLRCYLDTDFSNPWRVYYSDKLYSRVDQSTGLGIGIEYAHVDKKNYTFTLGGRYYLDRQLQSSTHQGNYQLNTLYIQIAKALFQDALSFGLELNYSFHTGNPVYTDGGRLSGDWGYGAFFSSQIGMFRISTGFRADRGLVNDVWGDRLKVISEGFFLQTGVALPLF